MPTPFDNAALVGVGSCGCNQTVHSPYALPGGVEPFLVADFVNGVYTVEGDPVAVTEMFDGNAEWGGFNAATDIQAGVGYVGDGGNGGTANFIGAALTRVLSESTMLIEFTALEGGTGFPEIDMHDDDWTFEYALTNSAGNIVITDYQGNVTVRSASGLTAGDHGLVMSFLDGEIAASFDNGAVVTNEVVPWSPPPTQFYLQPVGPIRVIALYPPQENATLPTLWPL